MNGTSVSTGTRLSPISISQRSFQDFPESLGKWKTRIIGKGIALQTFLPPTALYPQIQPQCLARRIFAMCSSSRKLVELAFTL